SASIEKRALREVEKDRDACDDAAPSLRLQTLDDFVVQPQVSDHVEKVWPSGGIVVAYGPPKEGKTFTMCDLAMHAAHGSGMWQGLEIREPLRIAFLAGEGTRGLKVRLHAWRQHSARTARTCGVAFTARPSSGSRAGAQTS